MANPLEASDGGDPSSLIERLSMLADDLRAARQRLLQAGHLSSHTAAARAEAHVIGVLIEQLGIDESDVAGYGREARAVSKLMAKLIDRNPKNAAWIARELRELGEPLLAAAVENRAKEHTS